MANIEVGMMVEIVPHPMFTNEAMFWAIGERAIVKAACDIHGYEDEWVLCGLEVNQETGNTMSFGCHALRPIDNDQKLSSWEAIQELTKWHPQEIEA